MQGYNIAGVRTFCGISYNSETGEGKNSSIIDCSIFSLFSNRPFTVILSRLTNIALRHYEIGYIVNQYTVHAFIHIKYVGLQDIHALIGPTVERLRL